ncbi:MAG: hypothetical protein U0K70_03100 [Acutalibacteraceae bacterium]|nr:hypothetical protein [Acutalibacteraceae bacterium]
MKKLLSLIIAAAFMILVITNPKVCTEGAVKGLLLSGRVIIPSLFPFTACVLFIMKSGGLSLLDFANPFTKRVFRLSPQQFSLMLLSFIGGYPVGGKLLNEAVKSGKISKENAGIMLNYCVNAGPAFIVLAVGGGILGSKKIGYILLLAHIISSLILSLVFGHFIKNDNTDSENTAESFSPADNFVVSVCEAASAIFSVCAYVILFSTVNEYMNCLSEKISVLKYISPLLEVTNAVTGMRNIVIIAFLLGFAGVSVWCQIISMGKLIKINFAVFTLSRTAHGVLSAVITALLLKAFGIAVTVSASVKYTPTYNGIVLSLSMLSMVIVLIISLFFKKKTGNILKDIV